MKTRNAESGEKERFVERISPHWGKLKGRANPKVAAWMRENNPMRNQSTRDKVSASMSGRTFLARGGNGTTTEPQRRLANALDLPMEYAVATAAVTKACSSLPNAYKVDIANPALRLAIEVDGRTHRQPTWTYLDRRKTEVLSALGWSVLRFTNEEVMTGLQACVETVNLCTTSR